MDAKTARRSFATLDGLRGVAAIAVVTRHTYDDTFLKLLPGSYLAVDLFFVLSGFVLAYAYEARLKGGLDVVAFMRMRIQRLYPLYALGAAFGGLVLLMYTRPLEHLPLLATTVGTVFMLPTTPALAVDHLHAFPFNLVAWSLFWELIVNLFYALIARHLTNLRLALLLFFGLAILAVTALHHGSLDVGFLAKDILAGGGRVLFTFFAGVALFRLWSATTWRPTLSSALVIVLLLAVFAAPVTGAARVAFDIVAAAVILPAIVFLGALNEPHKRIQPLYATLGLASYAVYTLQIPILKILKIVAHKVLHLEFVDLGVWGSLLAIIMIVVAALLADRYYDKPARAALGRLKFGAERVSARSIAKASRDA